MKHLLPILLLLFLPACQPEQLEQGLAGKVNGRPIPLKTLEFAQGLKLSAPTSTAHDEVLAKLRADYGETMADLIVEELVAQELAKRNAEVTEAELKYAETSARDGYQGKAFEEMLSEEGIDLGVWRERLRAKIAMTKFASLVLRPRVSIASWEVQQYYRSHAAEFTQPAKVKYLKVESKNADALRKALDAAKKARAPADLLTVFDDVSMQTLAQPEESLQGKLRDTLKALQPGQVSPVVQRESGFQAFILLERSEAKVEGMVQVYPIVEKRLAETKIAQEFTLWLIQTLNTSIIEISPGLLLEKGKH
ncbi:MAG: peptidyl-prolyl cis-trans isomerase [Desulfovibrio sp.]|nr:peptidyl-prolyl cis-trans isomerase [Desulfovibrio sp.]MBI4960186.1 peptidyl-prolyl cis-trans isomerase [Desulfovibrio sp.]